jgi:hypothetical protein
MIKREIIEDLACRRKIHVIYNAIDNQRFLPPTEETFVALRAKWNLPLQATCLIYVGSGFERKGWMRRSAPSPPPIAICWWLAKIRISRAIRRWRKA